MLEGQGNLTDRLLSINIKPSYQRVRIDQYLMDNQNHPTVDQIYSNLQKELPTLAKATVYNTLNLFLSNNLVKAITIEDKEARYDVTVEDHGHFKCEKCGQIYDFEIDMDRLKVNQLSGFQVKEKDVYFKGICSRCLMV